MVKRSSTRVTEQRNSSEQTITKRFTRVVAVIVALEHYRKPPNGEPLPKVDFAHADADSIADAVREIYKDMPAEAVVVDIMKDSDASLTGLRDYLKYTIRNLDENDLFIFYYAGHGFHGAGGNMLSAYDTNRANIADTSLHMRDHLLEPLVDSECRQALVFVDACAEEFRSTLSSRDVISNLAVEEINDFLTSGWYLGVFLSCSPGEKSYPAKTLRHGVWTHFLLEALSGRAADALTNDRWLTDVGLRDYLRRAVPHYILRETQIKGNQTPQAIVSASNTFCISHMPHPPAVPVDAALAGIILQNQKEYLESVETGPIKQLPGYKRGTNTVPTRLSDSADSWCQRLLSERVADELQDLYKNARGLLNARRSDFRKEEEVGAGTLDTSAFRYIIETGQNHEDPSEYFIKRRLQLRQDWPTHRNVIDALFGNDFRQIVIEFKSIGDAFDELVDKLEDIAEEQGGDVDDDDHNERVSYSRDGITFTFDLAQDRLEITCGSLATLKLIDAARKFQLGIGKASPMLSAPKPEVHS